MKNMLLEEVEYKVEETPFGYWRRFVYPSGERFAEFISHRWVLGLPLVHYTCGKCPETGKRIVAKGIIAVGRLAVGGIAIGHASAGVIAIGQLGIGLLLGLGQASVGLFAIGQLAVAAAFGVGQFVSGYAAIGQIAWGEYVLAQIGYGSHVWDTRGVDQLAAQFFRQFLP